MKCIWNLYIVRATRLGLPPEALAGWESFGAHFLWNKVLSWYFLPYIAKNRSYWWIGICIISVWFAARSFLVKKEGYYIWKRRTRGERSDRYPPFSNSLFSVVYTTNPQLDWSHMSLFVSSLRHAFDTKLVDLRNRQDFGQNVAISSQILYWNTTWR